MNQKTSRVLIVDDMQVNRMILSSLLAAGGVACDQAESGEACLALCERNEYDLIFLDHRMPEQDGVDTLLLLKEMFERKGCTIPVVCHTTEEGQQNINLYKAAGFSDVLIKPIDPVQLSEVLLTYLPDHGAADKSKSLLTRASDSADDAGTGDGEEFDIDRELERLPVWLKTVPHIDLRAGIENCGDAVDYIDALYVFYSSIEEKTSHIETFLRAEDYPMLRLHVHSLKSLARLIGARHLCESAASIEEAISARDNEDVKKDTPQLLDMYRSFSKHLKHLTEDESVKMLLNADTPELVDLPEESDHTRTVLFIHDNPGIVSSGIENKLRAADFTVISIPDEPDKIITYRFKADIVVYYPILQEESHIGITMNLLGEICQDDAKILCLTGDVTDLKQALSFSGSHRVSRSYPRPVNMQHFIDDMNYFSELLQEYHRPKSLFIVDDDPDDLTVLHHWLSPSYRVTCFTGASQLLDGLNVSLPDLILMDYEMPEMDGYELMTTLRTQRATKKIPIIFLTGKNDRDLVYRVLEHKPDGYLLKTSQKDSLLEAIGGFFRETVFRESL